MRPPPPPIDENLAYNRTIKKSILSQLFTLSSVFYVHCMNHPELILGRRKLSSQEQEEGIVLVFGPYSSRNLNWNDTSIVCELQFQYWENIIIPYESIARIFDKEGQVMMNLAAVYQEYDGELCWYKPFLKTRENLFQNHGQSVKLQSKGSKIKSSH